MGHIPGVTPVLVASGQAAAFLLPPAFVGPQHGHTKLGRELPTSEHWLPQWAPRLAAWGPDHFPGR